MHMQEGGEQQGLLTEGAAILRSLESQMEKWELQRLLGGEYDEGGAMLSIQVWPCLYRTGRSLARELKYIGSLCYQLSVSAFLREVLVQGVMFHGTAVTLCAGGCRRR